MEAREFSWLRSLKQVLRRFTFPVFVAFLVIIPTRAQAAPCHEGPTCYQISGNIVCICRPHWVPVINWQGSDFGQIAFDPGNPNTIYAALNPDGVFESTDGGVHWSLISQGVFDLRLSAIAIDPFTPGTLYVGTFGGHVFESADSGVSWFHPEPKIHSPINTIVASEPWHIYVGTYDTGLFANYGESDCRSMNEGLTSLDVRSVTFSCYPPTGPTSYVATHGGGVFRYPYTSEGSGWVAVNQGLGSLNVTSLACDQSQGTAVMMAATNDRGIFKSLNGGNNWDAASDGLTDRDVTALASSGLDYPFVTFYAGTRNGGIFRNTDPSGSGRWEQLNVESSQYGGVLSITPDPNDPKTLYVATAHGLIQVQIIEP
jgi:photosystem II stability/assembly factor-like uncharacterized protein